MLFLIPFGMKCALSVCPLIGMGTEIIALRL